VQQRLVHIDRKADDAEPHHLDRTAVRLGTEVAQGLRGHDRPGRNRVPLIRGRTYPVDALIEVPDGFITPGGWVVENGQNGTQYGDLMFWGDVDRVDTNPCGAGRLVKPGPTVMTWPKL
jgi:hypothetical protein